MRLFRPLRSRALASRFRLGMVLIAWMAGIGASFGFAEATVPGESPVFERDVLPIFVAHCVKCHGFEARLAGLDLRTVAFMKRGGEQGSILTPGSLEKSKLYQRVVAREMPPKDELPLTSAQVATIEAWVAAGAPADDPEPTTNSDEAPVITDQDREFWAFKPPARSEPPAVRDTTRARTPIDAFLLAKLESKGLRFSPDADSRSLVRRLYFDLLGIPPTPEEIEEFLKDTSDSGYERLLDRLLASPHFGERWGRHWLDVAGYVDVFGSDNDAAIVKIWENKWRFRDYVTRSFNEDKPFDRFLTEQLAGDELVDWKNAPRFTPEILDSLVATGYLRAAVDDTAERELNTADIRFRVLHLTLDIVGTGLLGMTTGCARCHTHKFDPIPQQDYYRLMALLTPAYNPQNWVTVDQRYLPDVSPAEQAEISAANTELDRRIAEEQAKISAIEAPYIDAALDVKLSAIPEPIRADTKASIQTPAEKRSEVQKYLTDKFAQVLALKPEDWASSVSAEDQALLAECRRRIEDIGKGKRGWNRLPVLYDVGPPSPTYLLRRGDHLTPASEVEPGFLSVFAGSDPEAASRDHPLAPAAAGDGTSGRRLALAKWLTDPRLASGGQVARVFVNRAWQHLFGQGIVATPENFGHSGARPTHPELLDWLAIEFMDGGWRLKPLLKRMLLSTAYRQATVESSDLPNAEPTNPDPNQVDPANELLWKARLRRLESESVRDAILAASGKLDLTIGGPPLPLENRPDGMVVVDSAKLPAPAGRFRRSLYVLARRNYHLSLLNDFDQPTVATNCPKRSPSAVVLQSLTMLNDDFVAEMAQFFEERVTREVTAAETLAAEAKAAQSRSAQTPAEHSLTIDSRAFVARAFEIAFARPPTSREVELATDLIDRQTERYRATNIAPEFAERQGRISLTHMLLCGSEFLYLK